MQGSGGRFGCILCHFLGGRRPEDAAQPLPSCSILAVFFYTFFSVFSVASVVIFIWHGRVIPTPGRCHRSHHRCGEPRQHPRWFCGAVQRPGLRSETEAHCVFLPTKKREITRPPAFSSIVFFCTSRRFLCILTLQLRASPACRHHRLQGPWHGGQVWPRRERSHFRRYWWPGRTCVRDCAG